MQMIMFISTIVSLSNILLSPFALSNPQRLTADIQRELRSVTLTVNEPFKNDQTILWPQPQFSITGQIKMEEATKPPEVRPFLYFLLDVPSTTRGTIRDRAGTINIWDGITRTLDILSEAIRESDIDNYNLHIHYYNFALCPRLYLAIPGSAPPFNCEQNPNPTPPPPIRSNYLEALRSARKELYDEIQHNNEIQRYSPPSNEYHLILITDGAPLDLLIAPSADDKPVCGRNATNPQIYDCPANMPAHSEAISIVKDMRKHGISVHTFQVGQFDDVALSQIAKAGDGIYHRLSNTNDMFETFKSANILRAASNTPAESISSVVIRNTSVADAAGKITAVVSSISEDGGFSGNIPLVEGINRLEVIATTTLGRRVVQKMKVYHIKDFSPESLELARERLREINSRIQRDLEIELARKQLLIQIEQTRQKNREREEKQRRSLEIKIKE